LKKEREKGAAPARQKGRRPQGNTRRGGVRLVQESENRVSEKRGEELAGREKRKGGDSFQKEL